MSEYSIFYTESNIICLIIFAIMLIHDLIGIDRQEKQIKFDHALIAFMCYFVSDAIWSLVIDGVIPRTEFSVVAVNFANYLFMAGITYFWLRFVMAVEQTPNRNKPLQKIAVAFPFLFSTIALILVYVFARSALLDDALNTKPLNDVFLIAVPIIYIVAILFYSIRKAIRDTNPMERRNHILIGSIPILVIAGGLLQTLVLPNTPIFCFCCAILMLIFYILSMETSISLDPLTGLNNRGQLMRVVSQWSLFQMDNRHTFIVMMDINDFKEVNDTYGHAEGDAALVILAESLKQVAGNSTAVSFVGRYGGDEFIMIVHSEISSLVDGLIEAVRRQIAAACDNQQKPYLLSVGVGYDELGDEGDSIKNCIQRADAHMYLDKERCKNEGKSTIIRRDKSDV